MKSKTKKEKSNRKTEKRSKNRKIGRIFNPIVRVLQFVITALVVYIAVMVTAVYVVPMIGGLLASVINIATLNTWISLLTLWVIPYLFVVGFLFIGVLRLIKFVATAICDFADKLILDYKTQQEQVNNVNEESDSE